MRITVEKLGENKFYSLIVDNDIFETPIISYSGAKRLKEDIKEFVRMSKLKNGKNQIVDVDLSDEETPLGIIIDIFVPSESDGEPFTNSYWFEDYCLYEFVDEHPSYKELKSKIKDLRKLMKDMSKELIGENDYLDDYVKEEIFK